MKFSSLLFLFPLLFNQIQAETPFKEVEAKLIDDIARSPKQQKSLQTLLKLAKEVDGGGDPNLLSKSGITPLMGAVLLRQKEAIHYLLARGANPSLKNKQGKTSFDLTQDVEIKDILKKEAWCFTFDDAIAFLENKSDPDMVKDLHSWERGENIKHGPFSSRDMMEKEKNEELVFSGLLLSNAIQRGYLQLVPFLISKGANINAPAFGGHLTHPPLMAAMFYNQPEIARLLVTLGADVNQRFGSDSDTILNYALSSAEMFQYFLDHGAKLPTQPKEKQNLIEGALRQNSPEVLEFLIGKTPIWINVPHNKTYLASNITPTVLQWCLDHGYPVKEKDENNRSLIDLCHRSNRRELLELLLDKYPVSQEELNQSLGELSSHNWIKRGAAYLNKPVPYFNEKDKDGAECVDLLLKKGADINAQNNEGQTLLVRLVRGQQSSMNGIDPMPAILDYLLDRGANPNLRDKEGKNALDYCVGNSSDLKEVIERKMKSKE